MARAIVCLLIFCVIGTYADYNADVPDILLNDVSPLDDSSAKFLKSLVDDGLALNNPQVCHSLGFFCGYLADQTPGEKTTAELPAKRSLVVDADRELENVGHFYESKRPFGAGSAKQNEPNPIVLGSEWRRSKQSDPNPFGVGQWRPATGSDPNPFGVGHWRPATRSDPNPFGVGHWRPATRSDPNPFGVGHWRPATGSDPNPFGVGQWRPATGSDPNPFGIEKALAARAFRLAALQVGKSILLPYIMEETPNKLLHPLLAESMPFNYQSLAQVMRIFNIPPSSPFASDMARSLQLASVVDDQVESRKPFVSVKDMVEFAGSILCNSSSGVDCHLHSIAQSFENKSPVTVNIADMEELAKDSVACHTVPFPYEVYACHKIIESTIYKVTVKEGDETKVLPAMCHMNTADFRPDHPAFKDLNMKPGDGEVCHWMAYKTLVWYA